MSSASTCLLKRPPHYFPEERKKNALLKKCGVMEALNKHERFILESPIIPP